MACPRFQTALAAIVPVLLLAGSAGVQMAAVQAQSTDSILQKLQTPLECTFNQEQTDFMLASFPNKGSATECHLLCAEHPQCAAFTYYVNTKTCLLHSRVGTKVTNEQARWGPKRCAPCLVADIDVKVDTVKEATVSSVQECARQCHTVACTFYVYHPATKKCYVKKYVDGLQGKIFSRSGYYTGLHNCTSQHWCNAEGFEIQGESLETTTADGPVKCSEICLNRDDCAAFSYVQASKTCSLKSQSSFGTMVQKAGAYAGPKSCGLPEPCEQQGKRRVGGFIAMYSTTVAKTARACQKKCTLTERCFHYSVGPDGCSLHTMDSTLEDRAGYISGDMICQH
ncbi:putative PAN domain-containing protein [Neospora caninum Liverpool]|uniref:PAN domain-containing protein, putative n=1 Tax=Neospora caninum (strain Liverpool) TaxID=572307 RepID=F0VI90_NEOCL|nr:putative PAN domain-containing protein [Neospora caninum Liverpool]CBZ53451.1 putative PAN domain-containing protein [Neospora caninum Liverpool]CEL67438.1 TPA: PAN domain-containing protein, putative [Neospora caninum Liverpool]|eukprot:XP_003883483.1 putative PAN domain-containing protein [Neospora caninum Liverpool]